LVVPTFTELRVAIIQSGKSVRLIAAETGIPKNRLNRFLSNKVKELSAEQVARLAEQFKLNSER
jgi:plasmid maintenance system antidote protein VapI